MDLYSDPMLIKKYEEIKKSEEIKNILEMAEFEDEKIQGLLTPTIWKNDHEDIKEADKNGRHIR